MRRSVRTSSSSSDFKRCCSPGSVADFDSWTKMSGHELVSSDESDGVYTYLIRKGR
jgi:TusA-related sulfurtransferase